MASKTKRNATPVALLRLLAWAVVAVCLWSIGNLPGPGGQNAGFILGGSLAAYLIITRPKQKKRK